MPRLKGLLTLCLIFSIVITLNPVHAQTKSENTSQCSLIVITKVKGIDEPPRIVVDGWAVYRTEYSFVDVLKGQLKKTEINVVHLESTERELDGLQVGNKVLLCLEKAKRSKQLSHIVIDSADYRGELLLIDSNCTRQSGNTKHPK